MCWQNKGRVGRLPCHFCVSRGLDVFAPLRDEQQTERRWSEASFADVELGTALRPPTYVLHAHSPVMRCRGAHSELSTSDGEPFSHKCGEWLPSEKCPWAFLLPLLVLIPTRTEGMIALLPALNSATGQNHFFTLRPQGRGSQTGSVLRRKWLCPGGITSGDILLSISGTSRRGNEAKRELSGYFLVEISVVVDLAKTYYLRVKCIYTQLLHSQYKPFQT